MAVILLQNGPNEIKNFADISNAVQGTLHFEEIKRLFGLLFQGNQNFYSSGSETVNEELSKISERMAHGAKFSDYELMKLYHMHNMMRSSAQFADAYMYYTQAKGLVGLFNQAAEFAAKNNPHTVMLEEAERVLKYELPGLTDILAGKEETVLHDAQKLWQAKANIWIKYSVSGLKTVKSNRPVEELSSLAADREKLARSIISEMPEFSDKHPTIFEIIRGKIEYYPRNKKDRLFYNRYLEVRDKCLRQTEGFSEAFNKLRQEVIDSEKIVGEQARELHGRIIGLLKDKSAVSAEEAREWASKNVYISKKVAIVLKNIGYEERELKKDIAEYYQLCGGKLGPVEFIGTGRRQRAYAHGKYQIEFDSDFDKRALFHECSHLVESHSSLGLASSQQFIKDRANGEPKRLNEIIEDSGYGNDEVAYPDTFIDPYVGKIYNNASEVLSMGLQMFASPDTLLYFMRNDPEHFKLTISQCLDHNDILKENLRQENERASKIMAEVNRKVDLQSAWKKSLKEAMPSNFKEALLLSKGEDGCKLDAQKRSQGGYLFIYDSTGREKYRTFGKIPELLVIAYLYLVSKNSLLPGTGYGTGDDVKVNQIERDISGSNHPPDWFDPDTGLPKYSLSPDALNGLKHQDEDKKLHMIFMNALDHCMTDEIFVKLRNNGVEGYTMMMVNYEYADFYSGSLQKLGNSGYVGKFELGNCLRLATMLILNKRRILPVTIDNEKQAIREYRKYVEMGSVPEWFEEDMTLPKL